MRVLLTNLAVLLLAETASALQLSSAIATCRAPALRRSTTPQLSLSPEDEPNPEDASEYSVDWDTAWSKEISSREEGTQQWRPEGREAVTEQQLATARATKAMDDASFNMQMAATVRITARFLSLSLCAHACPPLPHAGLEVLDRHPRRPLDRDRADWPPGSAADVRDLRHRACCAIEACSGRAAEKSSRCT